MRGKNETGWTEPKKDFGQRPVRDEDHGKAGQSIWWRLEELGFVQDEIDIKHPLSVWEQKLKNWLIWGYYEE